MISVAERHRQQPLLRCSVLVFMVLVYSWNTFEDFMLGRYDKVLWQMVLIPVLLLAAVLLWLRKHKSHNDSVVLPALVICAAGALCLLPQYPQLVWHQILMPPLVGYFCLREKVAHVFAAGLGALVLLIGLLSVDPLLALQGTAQYAMITGSVACYAVMVRMRDASLNALALKDWESLAYTERQLEPMVQQELLRSGYNGKQLSLIGFQVDDYDQLKSQTNVRLFSRLWPAFVRALQDDVRAGDEVFRQRDDLFVLMLPDCPEDGAIVLMERIRRHLGETEWPGIGELSLMTATVTSNPGEKSADLARRLFTRMAKQKRASLQSAAF